jgi:hypothetical protein
MIREDSNEFPEIVLPMIPDDNAITIPEGLEGKFLEQWTTKLKTNWVLHCMDNGYGVVHTRRIQERYIDDKGASRSRVVGYQLVFQSSEQAIMFKLRFM